MSVADEVLKCPEKILIGAAFKTEIAGLVEILKPSLYACSDLTIEYLITGMGMKNVRHCLNEKIGNGYTAILNVGTAGSVRAEIELLTVFYPTVFYSLVNDNLHKHQAEKTFLGEHETRVASWKRGALFSSHTPVTSYIDKQNIIEGSQADAVDMEAFAYADFCQRCKIPFYCLKVITDRTDADTSADFKTNLAAAAQKLTDNVPLLIDSIMKINCTKVTPDHG